MITNYTSLQSSVGTWLNRSDLTSSIPEFIEAAEELFKNDTRLKKLKSAVFTIDADDETVPTDFDVLQSWYHDGPVYYGPIAIVSPDALGELKGRLQNSGVPQYAAIIDGKFRFAPTPSGSYDTKITYWQTLGKVSTGTSWLFTESPSLYLYGALVASAPFLKDDDRVVVWEREVEKRIEQLRKKAESKHYSGSLRRTFRPIG